MAMKVKAATETATETKTATGTQPATRTGFGLRIHMAVQPVTKTPPETAKPPPKQKPPPKLSRTKEQEPTKEPTPEEIRNATAVKAGMGWWLRFQDGRLKFYRELPTGVKNVKPGKGSGYRSVQTFQGKPVDATFKMGFQRVKLHKPSREPGKVGAVSYAPEGTRRPGLSVKREGQLLHIKGVGISRKMPKGRILKS
jgi:hypothetical protein